jgi:hypothetical protein
VNPKTSGFPLPPCSTLSSILHATRHLRIAWLTEIAERRFNQGSIANQRSGNKVQQDYPVVSKQLFNRVENQPSTRFQLCSTLLVYIHLSLIVNLFDALQLDDTRPTSQGSNAQGNCFCWPLNTR